MESTEIDKVDKVDKVIENELDKGFLSILKKRHGRDHPN
jgi:hypothetical protein